MAMFIENPRLEDELKAQRQEWGVDQHDEVWEGVYFMAPAPNDDHQDVVLEFAAILREVISLTRLGKVRPGINLAGSVENWKEDYRVPDVVAFLNDTTAVNHGAFWTGAADFVIEITSPGDRAYDKIPFYSRLGVRELLIFDRQKKTLELYRHRDGELSKIGESTLARPDGVLSNIVPLDFRLIPGEPRPKVEIRHTTSAEQWVV
jgi:Uma2 family endonuclease